MTSYRRKWELSADVKDAGAGSIPMKAVRDSRQQSGETAEHDAGKPTELAPLKLAQGGQLAVELVIKPIQPAFKTLQAGADVGGDLFEDRDAPVQIVEFAHRPALSGGILRSVIDRAHFAVDDQRRRHLSRNGAASPLLYQPPPAKTTGAGAVVRRSL